ncbi:MAG: helix-hairpin-helix domain-containing protein [Propioniciclava sp.]
MADVVRRRLRAVAGHQPSDDDPPAADAAGAAPLEDTRSSGAGAARFGRPHAIALVLVAVLGLGWAGWSVAGAQARPVAVATPSPVPVSSGPPPTPEATPTPALRVHVLGAVTSPGVVELAAGARVEDALAAAGGLTPKARPGELNLAAPVQDGAQIIVGDVDDPGGEVRDPDAGTAGSSSHPTKVNLNTATVQELEALPGVGPVTASAILAWREENGAFADVAQLEEVAGIGPGIRARLEPSVTV